MIVSKPKSQTVFALSLFQVIIFAVTIWVILDLVRYPEAFFFLKITLAPILLVIWTFVAVKFYTSLKTIELGDHKISYKFPLQTKRTFNIAAIQSWKEEKVKTRGNEFKELQIQLANRWLKVSNREHTAYEEVRKYLSKKVKRKS